MKLDNKIAVVTGASRGIGKALALAIAEHGGQVGLLARTILAKASEFDLRLPEIADASYKAG